MKKATYTQGVCMDGAAILKDGRMMTADEIVSELKDFAAQSAKVREDWLDAVKDFYNLTIADRTVIIRPQSAEQRDRIAAAGERVRCLLLAAVIAAAPKPEQQEATAKDPMIHQFNQVVSPFQRPEQQEAPADRQCRHCGFLCRPNPNDSGWHPLEQQEAVECKPMPAVTEDGWSEWVSPKPSGYLMQCCDCGLIHEMQFAVVKYATPESDECEPVQDPDYQSVFRARRHEAFPPKVDQNKVRHIILGGGGNSDARLAPYFGGGSGGGPGNPGVVIARDHLVDANNMMAGDHSGEANEMVQERSTQKYGPRCCHKTVFERCKGCPYEEQQEAPELTFKELQTACSPWLADHLLYGGDVYNALRAIIAADRAKRGGE